MRVHETSAESVRGGMHKKILKPVLMSVTDLSEILFVKSFSDVRLIHCVYIVFLLQTHGLAEYIAQVILNSAALPLIAIAFEHFYNGGLLKGCGAFCVQSPSSECVFF